MVLMIRSDLFQEPVCLNDLVRNFAIYLNSGKNSFEKEQGIVECKTSETTVCFTFLLGR